MGHVCMCVLYIDQGRDGGRENEFLERRWEDVISPLYFFNEIVIRLFFERKQQCGKN